jgi:hypothetical protein
VNEPFGKIEIACTAGSHPRRVIRRVRWRGGKAAGQPVPWVFYWATDTVGGVHLVDDQPVRTGDRAARIRTAFHCSQCGDRVEARTEKALGAIFQTLAENGIWAITLDELRPRIRKIR